MTRNHLCRRREALPPRPSQDGGGYSDRAAVFRHVQAPERGGNAAGASGAAAPLLFPPAVGVLLPAPGPSRAAAGRGVALGERGWVGPAAALASAGAGQQGAAPGLVPPGGDLTFRPAWPASLSGAAEPDPAVRPARCPGLREWPWAGARV